MDPSENLDQPAFVASLIDHTLLKPDASESDIGRICEEAKQYAFASVCVNPCWVSFAAACIRGSNVKVCTVIGFPLGANAKETKSVEAQSALLAGASELDMVQNVGALCSGHFGAVASEILEIAELAHSGRALLKVILETSLLTQEQKEEACRLAVDNNADYLKTSTGFSAAGATVEDVALMRRIAGDALGVKASGGVRSLASLRAMVQAGANRIGTSSGVQILKELEQTRSGTADPQTDAGGSY